MLRRRETNIFERNSGKYEYRFVIYDYLKGTFLIDIPLTDGFYIGLFLSGYYTIIDGHMYVRNNIIKIRYDYIEKRKLMHVQAKWLDINETHIFDVFDDIIDLKANFQISTKNLMNAISSHRIGFLQ